MPAMSEERLRVCDKLDGLPNECGEPMGNGLPCGAEVPGGGVPLNEPALKRLNGIGPVKEFFRAAVMLSSAIEEGLCA